jgi:sigma-B regulation protein RsbU (phosphoserine phosphatase)
MPAREAGTGSSYGRSSREALDALREGGAAEDLVDRVRGLVEALESELREARRALSVNTFALHSLIDASQDLTESAAEDSVLEAVLTSVMGHFLVSRGALYVLAPHGLSLARSRGMRRAAEREAVRAEDARAALARLEGPAAVRDLPEGPLRRRLEGARMTLAIPLSSGGGAADGILAIGGRASGAAFSDEDKGVAAALARQAGAALENARLQRVREEKLRQDRELQIAREIQESLLPKSPPEVPGFTVAGRSRPCYEVGGDSYDWIPLGDERLALVVADVAGKGTPASLLMASVHASVQLLAGTVEPARLVARLNRFLCARAPSSRFVTLLYAELDASTRRLRYVNAGHVPPYRVARDGTVDRLLDGGPALGLLADASYEVGEVLLRPGELVAIVTDGVTEAVAPGDVEFGDERVCEALRGLAARSAARVLDGLLASVEGWTAGAGFGDDLTAVILEAREEAGAT